MTLSTGYLTTKQRLIWGLKNSGIKEAHIARQLDITRQTVHKIIDIANTRIEKSLKEAAELNKIEIKTIDAPKGFLSGYSSQLKTDTFVTFSAKNGIQIWYKHEGNCSKCHRLKICREVLVAEATDRKYLITEDIDQINPLKLADALFSRLTAEKEEFYSFS
jgi:hypothetical protein